LVAVLERMGHRTGIDLRTVLRAADIAHQHLMSAPPTIDSVSLASGVAGVFSGFKTPVLDCAASFGIDPLDLFFALGERRIIAGQEDLIALVAAEIATTRKET
jgi:4-hydroxy 2-oxovalerate aldolase